jgi:hypothetical protein
MCSDAGNCDVLWERAIYQFLPVECSCSLTSEEYLEFFSYADRPWVGTAQSLKSLATGQMT